MPHPHYLKLSILLTLGARAQYNAAAAWPAQVSTSFFVYFCMFLYKVSKYYNEKFWKNWIQRWKWGILMIPAITIVDVRCDANNLSMYVQQKLKWRQKQRRIKYISQSYLSSVYLFYSIKERSKSSSITLLIRIQCAYCIFFFSEKLRILIEFLRILLNKIWQKLRILIECEH